LLIDSLLTPIVESTY